MPKRRNKTSRRNVRNRSNQTVKSRKKHSRRGETETEATATAIAARMVHTGLPYAKAKKQDAGTAIGRLFITGEISQKQLDAANKYCELSHNNNIAIGAARMRSCCDVGPYGRSTETTDRQIERETRWIREYREVRRVALQASPLADMILQGVITDNKDMLSFMGDLRLVLNAVHNTHAGN